ncbi:MAG TPA: cupin domain-containing protein [Acidobacteriota bacterium]|nr:cupin domain-containing protein [Acidobacteriota bacterium]
MAVIKQSDIEFGTVPGDDVSGVVKANVIGPTQGWQSHVMRVFRIEPGGYTPRHRHAWEHVNYIISGRGRLRLADTVHEVRTADFAFVPPDTEHQFENPSDEPFEFICIVPQEVA